MTEQPMARRNVPTSLAECAYEVAILAGNLERLTRGTSDPSVVAERMFDDGASFSQRDEAPFASWLERMMPTLAELNYLVLPVEHVSENWHVEFWKRGPGVTVEFQVGIWLPAPLCELERAYDKGYLRDYMPFTVFTDDDGCDDWEASNFEARQALKANRERQALLLQRKAA